MSSPSPPTAGPRSRRRRIRAVGPSAVAFVAALGLAPAVSSCTAESREAAPSPTRPDDVPALHHAGLNTVDAEAAIGWYLRLWPSAERSSFAGRPAVDAEMDLVFQEVASPPPGAFEPSLGRPAAQSAFWHIGAFANTTDMDERLSSIGVEHLPLYTGPDDEEGVWRSGLSPFGGIVTLARIPDEETVPPRPGGFSYVLGPDGALFELTGGPDTDPSLSHVHFFHEQPRCAANWYVEVLGMSLPPVRNEDGSTSAAEPWNPCESAPGEAGWPSLEREGTIRQPRATVVHTNGSMSFYPRQCVGQRCGTPRPLIPSRGQVLDHVGFSVKDVEAWASWLTASGVAILEEIRSVEGVRTFMFEGPDGLAIELVEGDG